MTDLGAGEANGINDNGWICGALISYNCAVLWRPIVPSYGITNKAAYDPIISTAWANFLFKVWGKVTTVDGRSFTVDDGSGMPVKVIAPGYTGIANNDYASATGMFTGDGTSRVLNAQASDVVKVD